jgi:hypothetical protein
MGNAFRSSGLGSDDKEKLITALREALPSAGEMLGEHIEWALAQINKAPK